MLLQQIYAKTKAQISCAVTAQLISTFVLHTKILRSLCLIQNLKLLAIYCGTRFMLDLVENPEDRVFHETAHI